jgi:hypothetical protein
MADAVYLKWRPKAGGGRHEYIGRTSDGTDLFEIAPARKRIGWDLIRRSGARETCSTLQAAKAYGDNLARGANFKHWDN